MLVDSTVQQSAPFRPASRDTCFNPRLCKERTLSYPLRLVKRGLPNGQPRSQSVGSLGIWFTLVLMLAPVGLGLGTLSSAPTHTGGATTNPAQAFAPQPSTSYVAIPPGESPAVPRGRGTSIGDAVVSSPTEPVVATPALSNVGSTSVPNDETPPPASGTTETTRLSSSGQNEETPHTPTNAADAAVVFAGRSSVVGTVQVGILPVAVSYNTSSGYVYVVNSNSNNVSIIDGSILVASPRVGTDPDAVLYDPSNGFAYVANDATDNVSIIRGTTTIMAVPVGTSPQALAFDPANGWVYVANYRSGNVTAISGSKVVANITVGINSTALLWDPFDDDVYVANFGSNSVSIISGATVVNQVAVGNGPDALNLTTQGDIYVADETSNLVTIISGTSVVGSVRVGTNPDDIVVDSSNNVVYVPNLGTSNVSLISGVSLIGTVHVGSSPNSGVYDAQNGFVYIPNAGSHNVSVIGGSTVIDSVNVGKEPRQALVDPKNGFVYVINYGSNNVSLIGTLVVDRPTSTYNPLDVGQSSTLSVQAVGGTGTGYTYSWAGLPSPCSSTLPSFTCVPNTAGSYSITVTVRDSNGDQATSPPLNLTVDSDPTVAVTPKGPFSYDTGQTAVTLDAVVSYVGPNVATVSWYYAPSAPCGPSNISTGSTGTSYTPSTASLGTRYYCAVVTDGGVPGYSNRSSSVSVQVNATLSAGVVTPSAATIDSGQSLNLASSTPTGGTPPYSLQWLAGTSTNCASDTALTGATSPGLTVTPTANTDYCLRYGDASEGSPASVVYSNVVTITVNPTLVRGTVSPASASIDKGQSLNLSTTAPTGGTLPYAYAWRAGSSAQCSSDAVQSGQTKTYDVVTPSSSTYFCVEYTDSSQGTPPMVQFSSTVLVTVNLPLSPGNATPASPAIDYHQSITLSATATDGTPLLSYQWYSSSSGSGSCSSGTAISGATSPTYTAAPSVSTYYCYVVRDNSSAGAEVGSSGWDHIQVNQVLSSGQITPTSVSMDAGQSLTLSSSSPTGGTPAYLYQWRSGSSTDCSLDPALAGDTSSTLTLSPTATAYFCTEYMDHSQGSPSAVNYSQAVLVTVYSPPLAGAILPSTAVIDAGQSVSLATQATGGTPPLKFQWYSSSAGTGACTSGTLLTGVTGTTYFPNPATTTHYCYTVTDNSSIAPETSASPWATVTVNPALQAGTLRPASATIDLGQSLHIYSTLPTGGTPNYTYQWLEGSSATCSQDAPINGQTSNTTVVAPTTTTYYCVRYGDSSVGAPAAVAYSATTLVQVNPILKSGTVTPKTSAIDSGQSLTLTSTVPQNGTPPYGYQWRTGSSASCPSDAAITGQQNATLTITPILTAYYCVEYSDSSVGSPTEVNYSATVLVVVNPALTASPVSPSGPTVDSGQSVNLTTAESGGTAPFTYQWYSTTTQGVSCSSGTTVTGGTAPKLVVTPSQSTYYCYAVKDNSTAGSEISYSAWDLVTVNPSLAAGSLSPSSSTIDLGQTVPLVSTFPSGGTPAYTFAWRAGFSAICSSDTIVSGQHGSSFNATPGTLTYYCVQYGDASQGYPSEVAYSNVVFISVNPTLASGTVSPPSVSLDLGQSFSLTTTAPTGGTPGYSYQWRTGSSPKCANDSNISGATSTTLSIQPTVSTYYCVLYTDSSQGTPPTGNYSNVVRVVVNAPLEAGPVSPNLPPIDIGQAILLSSEASYGTAPYSFQWYSYSTDTLACSSGNPITNATQSTLTTQPTGNTYYCYEVRDSSTAGAEVNASAWDLVTVHSVLAPGTVTPTSPTIDDGQSITLTATAPLNGTPTYSYQWVAGSSSTCSSDSPIPGATVRTLNFAPAVTSYICMRYGDSSLGSPTETAYSNAALIHVNGRLASGSVTPSSPSIDRGQTLTLQSSSPSLGTPTYTYQWRSGTSSTCAADTNISGATGTSFTVTPTADTYYCVLYGDSSQGFPAEENSSATILVVVSLPPSAGAIQPAGSIIDSGQSQNLTAMAAYGTQPYTYEWYSSTNGSGSCGSGSLISGATTSVYRASPTTTEYYCYIVSDSSSAGSMQNSSSWDKVVVDAALTAGTLSPTSADIDVGQSILLTTSAPFGGTTPYAYQWLSGSSSTCSSDSVVTGANASTYSPSPASTTYYCVEYSDQSDGTPAAHAFSATVLVTVNPPLSVGAVSPASAVIDLGQSMNLTASASGGTLPLKFQWYESSSNTAACSAGTLLSGATSSLYVAHPSATTYYCFQVADSSTAGAEVQYSGWARIDVSAALSPGSITPGSPAIDLGQSLSLTTSSPTGGTGPYRLQWLSGASSICSSDGAVSAANGSSYTITPAQSTYYCVEYRDSSQGYPTATVYSGVDLVLVNSALAAGSISPGNAVIDYGQSILLSSSAPSGGTPSYKYQWREGSSTTCSADVALSGATASSMTASPTSNTYYCVQYTDSSLGTPAQIVYSTAILVTVDPQLSPGYVNPIRATIDLGQTLVLNGSGPTGGTPTYSYQWVGSSNNGSCASEPVLSGQTGLSISVSPTGNAYYCLRYADQSQGSPAGVVYSAIVSISVNSALQAKSISPGSAVADSGQVLGLAANPTGGTVPYAYQWWSSATGSGPCDSGTFISGATQSSYITSGLSVGHIYYCYIVKDSSAAGPETVSSAWMTVTVNPALSAGSLTPSFSNVDSGQNISFAAGIPNGGTPAYSYVWREGTSPTCSLDTLIVGAHNATYTMAPRSSLYVCVVESDASQGTPAPQVPTQAAYVQVNTPLVSGNVSPGSAKFDVGQVLDLTAGSPTGGTQPYRLQWYEGTYNNCSYDAPISGANNSTYSIPSKVGTYVFCVLYTDGSKGFPETVLFSNAVDVTVNPTLVAAGVLESRPRLDAGMNMTLSALVSGGTAPLTYRWFESSSAAASCLGSTPVGPSSSNWNTPNLPPGTYYYCFEVSDSSSAGLVNKVSPWNSFTVFPDPVIISFTISPNPTDNGSAVALQVNVSGGELPYFYAFNGLPAPCQTQNLDVLTCTPTRQGTFPIQAVVQDANGVWVNDTVTLVVQARTAPLILSFAASPNPAVVGAPVAFSTKTTGNITGATIEYLQLPVGCLSQDELALVCTPGAVGVYQVEIQLMDPDGEGASAYTNLVVNSAGSSPGPIVSSFYANPNSFWLGNTTYLRVAATGTGTLSYSYTGLPGGCTTSDTDYLACTPNATGDFYVHLYVNDSNGHSTPVGLILIVTNPPSQTASGNNFGALEFLLVVVLLVAALLVFLWYRYRKKEGDRENAPSAPSNAMGSTFGPSPVAPPQAIPMPVVSGPVGRQEWSEDDGTEEDSADTAPEKSVESPIPTPSTASESPPETPTTKTSDFDKILGAVTGQELTLEELVEKTKVPANRLDALLNAMVAKKVILSGRRVGSGSRVFYAKGDKAGTKTQLQPKSSVEGKDGSTSPPPVDGADGKGAPAPEPGVQETTVPASNTELPIPSPVPEGVTSPPPPKAANAEPAGGPQEAEVKISSKDISDTLLRVRAEPQSQSRLRDGLSMSQEKLAMILRALSKQELLAQAGRDTNGERRYVLTKKGRRYLKGQNPGPLFIPEVTQGAAGNNKSQEQKLPTPSQSPMAASSTVETPIPANVETKNDRPPVSAVGESERTNPKTDTVVPESHAPAPEIAPGTRVQLERTIGPERKEENPFEGDIKPEEVNPNVRHLDPRLLQPMELRITMDRGTDVRQGDSPPNAEDKARELLERAQRSKNKRAGGYGVEQTAKPDERNPDE